MADDYQFRKARCTNPKIVRILKKFDVDGNGQLDAPELANVITEAEREEIVSNSDAIAAYLMAQVGVCGVLTVLTVY